MTMATAAVSAAQQTLAKGMEAAANSNTAVQGSIAGTGLLPQPGALETPPAPFADLIQDAVRSVGRSEVAARSAVEGLMSGSGVDVHTAMIATEKAEMGFELVLAVRNKALAAYQQVMGMQF